MKLKQNILIVGGTGFIGSYLVERLRQRRGLKILVGHKEKLTAKERQFGVAYYRLMSGNRRGQLASLLPEIDYLVWLAQPDEPAVRNLGSLINKAKCLKKIVYASTMLLYVDTPKPKNESALINPLTDYEKAKRKEELLFTALARSARVKLCIPRLANIYGGVKNRGVINYMFLALVNKEVFYINGNGEQKRDCLFVVDAVEALEKLIFLEQESPIEIFNIGSGQSYALNQIVDRLEKIARQPIRRAHRPPIKEKRLMLTDNKKIKRALKGWPRYNLVRGLGRAYLNYSKVYNIKK